MTGVAGARRSPRGGIPGQRPSRGLRRALIAVALSLSGPLACRGETPSSSAVAPMARSAAPGAPASASSRPPGPRDGDPRWQRARGDDPLERARLAEAEGAAGLLEALDDGREIAEAALLALPYADDADLALGPLSQRALAAPPADLGPLLQAILEIAGRPARQREPLDPEGARAAGQALLALAGRGALPPPTRALAVSGARALAGRGYVDPAAIPGDLDPR